MVAKYMSEKCIDILSYGKAELLQVYLFLHMSISLIVAQCEGVTGITRDYLFCLTLL